VNAGKSNYRALLIDDKEKWEQKQISWTGMPDMMFALLQCVCGAADIPSPACSAPRPRACSRPATASERDYQDMVNARQNEQLGPAFARSTRC
jgi:hypothetical protein